MAEIFAGFAFQEGLDSPQTRQPRDEQGDGLEDLEERLGQKCKEAKTREHPGSIQSLSSECEGQRRTDHQGSITTERCNEYYSAEPDSGCKLLDAKVLHKVADSSREAGYFQILHAGDDRRRQPDSFLHSGHPGPLRVSSEPYKDGQTDETNRNDHHGYDEDDAKSIVQHPRCQSRLDRAGPDIMQRKETQLDSFDISAH